jgi:hypothetical protein
LGDVDPTNATNTAAESFLQSADQDFTSDDDSSDFPAPGTDPGVDFPAPGIDPDADSPRAESSSGAAADRSASGRRDAARQLHFGPSAPPVSRVGWRFPPGGPADAGVSAASTASPGSSAAISPSVTVPTGSSTAGSTPDVSGSAISSGSSGSPVVSSPVAAPTVPLDRPHTRLQSGVSKTKKFTDGTIRYAYFSSTGEPSSTAEAFKDS